MTFRQPKTRSRPLTAALITALALAAAAATTAYILLQSSAPEAPAVSAVSSPPPPPTIYAAAPIYTMVPTPTVAPPSVLHDPSSGPESQHQYWPTSAAKPYPTASPTPTATPQPTAEPAPTPTPTSVPTRTPRPAPRSTPTPTPQPTPTRTPRPTPTAVPLSAHGQTPGSLADTRSRAPDPIRVAACVLSGPNLVDSPAVARKYNLVSNQATYRYTDSFIAIFTNTPYAFPGPGCYTFDATYLTQEQFRLCTDSYTDRGCNTDRNAYRLTASFPLFRLFPHTVTPIR